MPPDGANNLTTPIQPLPPDRANNLTMPIKNVIPFVEKRICVIAAKDDLAMIKDMSRSHRADRGAVLSARVAEFVEHYHRKRNHRGLGNRLITNRQRVTQRAACGGARGSAVSSISTYRRGQTPRDDHRDVVVLLVRAEPPDLVDDRVEQRAGRQVAASA